MDGIRVLRKAASENLSHLSSCENTARRGQQVQQEEDPRQTPDL